MMEETKQPGWHPAIRNLIEHQRQLDADGIEVGVSRQAVDEAIEITTDLLEALDHLITLFCDLAPLGENTEREVAVVNARAAIAKAQGDAQ
jgi:hypothetical protein